MKEKKEDYSMTATLKQRKLAGFVITLIASLIFIALSLSLIILTLQQGGSLSIENTTLIVLQFAALIFLLIGMLIHKENLILGTLIAAMASTVVSYMVNDVTSIVTGTLSFSGAWYLTASVVVSLVLDAFLSLGTISFLIYLLNGHQPTTRSVISFFFAGYLALALLQIVFISFGLAASAGNEEEADLFILMLLAFLSDVLVTFAFIVDIDAFFFRKDDDSLAIRIQESKEHHRMRKIASKKAISSLDQAIAEYQNTVLPASFVAKGDHLELSVDLRTMSIYEDCSNETLLNSAIYSFIEDVAFSLAGGHELLVRFTFPEGTSEEEKKKVAAIFRAHYAIYYKNLRDKVTKEMILAITFVFIGFLFITFHLPYVNANGQSVYGEMLDIFGWVFTWESVEILCVNSLDRQQELHQYQLLYTAAIEEYAAAKASPSK
jgi:hypothetical protein